ncbi:MAG: hypothetical protein V4543_11850 [Bacteroidota bacterium]
MSKLTGLLLYISHSKAINRAGRFRKAVFLSILFLAITGILPVSAQFKFPKMPKMPAISNPFADNSKGTADNAHVNEQPAPLTNNEKHELLAGQRQKWLPAHQQDNARLNDNVTRLYFDKFGHLYPDPALSIDEFKFFYPFSRDISYTAHSSGNLEFYFTNDKYKLDELRKFYHVHAGLSPARDFAVVQDSILARYTRQITSLCDTFEIASLVFMIHGFNVADPQPSFSKLRRSIKKYGYENTAKPLYIEVHWDGLYAKNPLVLSSIWPQALTNSKYVALGLRRFISRLNCHELPISIITHSLGAGVGTGALFNTISKCDGADVENNKALKRLMNLPPPDEPRIRLAMLAPAIPGGNTFIDFNSRSPEISPAKNNIDRIIIGYNPLDYATSKGYGKLMASRAGGTNLGCNNGYEQSYNDEISNVKAALKKQHYTDEQIDKLIISRRFTTPKAYGLYQQHRFIYYLDDEESMKVFLAGVFGE